jgi:hypothetical protein
MERYLFCIIRHCEVENNALRGDHVYPSVCDRLLASKPLDIFYFIKIWHKEYVRFNVSHKPFDRYC